MRVQEFRSGSVKWFNRKKRYGFILENGSKEEIFFHVSEVQSDRSPSIGDYVDFQKVFNEERKKYQATKVVYTAGLIAKQENHSSGVGINRRVRRDLKPEVMYGNYQDENFLDNYQTKEDVEGYVSIFILLQFFLLWMVFDVSFIFSLLSMLLTPVYLFIFKAILLKPEKLTFVQTTGTCLRCNGEGRVVAVSYGNSKHDQVGFQCVECGRQWNQKVTVIEDI